MVVDVNDTDAHDFQSTLVILLHNQTRSNLSKVSSCLIWDIGRSMAMAFLYL